VQGDICDSELVASLLREHRPRAVVHFAAESHVDRSIADPRAFIRTNVEGTFNLLQQSRLYWAELDDRSKNAFRFLHVSTDEVYGSLGAEDPAFSETTPMRPIAPMRHQKRPPTILPVPTSIPGLARSHHQLFQQLRPFQFPEKLIPLVILNALERKALPVYGDGMNVRDWLFVEDHCAAIRTVLEHGRIGETYNMAATASEPISMCDDHLRPRGRDASSAASAPRRNLITFVKDRPGHDRRYAIDASKISQELGWKPAEQFEGGLRKTVAWYLANTAWLKRENRRISRLDLEELLGRGNI